MINVYSTSEIKDLFVSGSKITLYFGESFFKMFNFLNTLQKQFQRWIFETSLIIIVFS